MKEERERFDAATAGDDDDESIGDKQDKSSDQRSVPDSGNLSRRRAAPEQ